MTAIDEGDADSINYSASVLVSSTIGTTITEVDSGDSKGIAIIDALVRTVIGSIRLIQKTSGLKSLAHLHYGIVT